MFLCHACMYLSHFYCNDCGNRKLMGWYIQWLNKALMLCNYHGTSHVIVSVYVALVLALMKA